MNNSIKIFLLSILIFLMGCNLTINNSKKISTNYSKTHYGKYLSASYSVRNGDVNNASKILSANINYNKEKTLIELAFYTKIINGEFKNAKKLKDLNPLILDKNSFSNIPEIVLYLKQNKFKKANEIISLSDDLPGFNTLSEKIKDILLAKKNVKLNPKKQQKVNIKDIYDLIIFEHFSYNNEIDDIIKQEHSDINKLLFLGYLRRKKILSKKIKEIHPLLPFSYDKVFIKKKFEDEKNIFLPIPESKLIIASYFINLANHLKKKNNIPSSYIKMLFEISNFIYPKLNFSNYYLSEIYENEKNDEIAMKKLNLIDKNSIVYIPTLIKKYRISKKDNPKEAELFFKELKNNFFNQISVKYELANSFRINNNCLAAIKIYNQILKERPNDPNVLFYKASCLEKSGKWNEAKKIFFKIIELNKNDAYSLNYLSYSMAIRNEDLNKALLFINDALKVDPNNGFFLDTLGWIQFKNKQYDLAIKTLQRAIGIQPNSSEIMDHLGDCYLKVGRIKEAIFEWQRALKYDASEKLKKNIKMKLNKYE